MASREEWTSEWRWNELGLGFEGGSSLYVDIYRGESCGDQRMRRWVSDQIS
jgi:hypothetical protein